MNILVILTLYMRELYVYLKN